MRTPTVTLRRQSDGKLLRVDRAKYAVNLMAYVHKGYRMLTEARGEASDADMAFQIGQMEIEAERQVTREQPKDYEARKIQVRPLDGGTKTVDDMPEANPDVGPKPPQDAPQEVAAADPATEPKKTATRATRGRRRVS